MTGLVAEASEEISSIEGAVVVALLGRMGVCSMVVLGEASQGTSEFYGMRDRITRELIRR